MFFSFVPRGLLMKVVSLFLSPGWLFYSLNVALASTNLSLRQYVSFRGEEWACRISSAFSHPEGTISQLHAQAGLKFHFVFAASLMS